MSTATFAVRHGSLRLKVTLRETVADVHQAYKSCTGTCPSAGRIVHAFFAPTAAVTAKYVGIVVLPQRGGRLEELVPHEVTHAVIRAHGGVLPHDDEACATAVGLLSARIFKRLRKMGVAV